MTQPASASASPSAAPGDPRYPVGRFAPPSAFTPESRAEALADVAALPARLAEAVAGLSEAQLDTPYREGGWTVRQLVHHVPDSHLNAYVRFKLALTEEKPTIKPYAEARWAELPDSRTVPVEVSLRLLDALHARWAATVRAMSPEEFGRTVVHPEHGRELSLDFLLAMYAWHGRHHVGHVTALREREGW